jgi:hypothetical protein
MKESLKEKWWEFHKNNPHVYELFKRFTHELIAAGFSNYSSKSVFERIRWHTDIKTRGSSLKLNNNYTAYYARLFHADHPEYGGFFRTRQTSPQIMDGEDH